MKAARPTTLSRKPAAPRRSSRAILSLVIRYENLGQLTVPNELSFGNDGRLYLTRSSGPEGEGAGPQAISLKESVGWFRLGQEYGLSVTKGDNFSEWLKTVEAALRQ